MAAAGMSVLVIGGGPCGLRMAVECLLLGCRVVVVEKREKYSRNNVLHLWPFTITDLKRLGAKKFYGKFCAGSLDHISEWTGQWAGQLMFIVCLLLVTCSVHLTTLCVRKALLKNTDTVTHRPHR